MTDCCSKPDRRANFLRVYVLRLLLPCLLLLLSVDSAFGQVSLVPSHHPVYDWLYQQRVAGNLPGYAYESLPLQRKQILEHLRSLRENASLRGRQEQTLQAYLREFDVHAISPASGHSVLFSKDSLDWRSAHGQDEGRLWNNREKHVALLRLDEGFVVGDAALGYRYMSVHDGDFHVSEPVALMTHLRVYGSLGSSAAMHFELHRANPTYTGDPYNYDSFYAFNWITQHNMRRGGTPEGHSYQHIDGYGTFAPLNVAALSIGRGNLKIGTGPQDNLLFSRNAYPLDWIRLDLGWPILQYQMVHGTLGWPSTSVVVQEDPLLVTKNSPQRFVRMHTLTVRPFNSLQLSAFEMVNYSNRGMEVAYLNPFNLLLFAERELHDQDSAMTGGFMVFRPFRGLEIYSELLIDDWRGFTDIFIFTEKKNPQTSRFGRRHGLQWVPDPALRMYLEFTRLDPFFYSHAYGLNAHTNNGFSLGSQLPPNSDRITVGSRLLGFRRTWLDMSVHSIRNGRDIYDEEGTMIFSSGWNPNFGRRTRGSDPYQESRIFLDGDPHRWMELHLDLSWEPRRAWVFSGRLDQRWMQKGDQMSNLSIFWAELTIGM